MRTSGLNTRPKVISVFEQLEDRVLFDGVPDATFLPQSDAVEPVAVQHQAVPESQFETSTQLVLIDSGVEDTELLLSSILEGRAGASIEVRILETETDGIDQISEILSESNRRYDAVHILSHGNAGNVTLGATDLSQANIHQYVDQMAAWSNALSNDADLLFYGCELAANESGRSLIEFVSTVTGADVAASNDLTGLAEKGGDWKLEEAVGTIETRSLEILPFVGVLIDTDGDNVDDVDDIDDDNDGILDVTEQLGTSTSTSSGVNGEDEDLLFDITTYDNSDGQQVVNTLFGSDISSVTDNVLLKGGAAGLDSQVGFITDFNQQATFADYSTAVVFSTGRLSDLNTRGHFKTSLRR